MVFFKPGDIVKWKPITREEYDQIVLDVESGKYQPKIKNVVFDLAAFNEDIDGTNSKLLETLNAN